MREKVRYISADLLRGLVMIIMIEVHVSNAFLLIDIKQSGWFSVLNFINGLVAPSFLFVSGFAFQVSSVGKLDEMRKFGKTFWKKIQRILQIVLIGYALHLPTFSLSELINKSTAQQLADFYSVDILQCIGVGLLFLLITRTLVKSDKLYHYFLIISLIMIAVASPFLWKIDFNQYVHPLIGNYFNNRHGSLFPLFPWINFLLAGAIFAKYFVDERKNNNEVRFTNRVFAVGVVLLLFGHLFFTGLFPNALTSIVPNPIFFLERFGYILVLFYFCWYADKNYNMKKSFILDASRESLLVYWLHLVIIYGMLWKGKSLALIIGNTLNVFESAIITLALIILMIIIAKVWGWIKTNYSGIASASIRIATAVLVLIFILI